MPVLGHDGILKPDLPQRYTQVFTEEKGAAGTGASPHQCDLTTAPGGRLQWSGAKVGRGSLGATNLS